jgi:glycosyltransferase involved in cell wall biosynthesis
MDRFDGPSTVQYLSDISATLSERRVFTPGITVGIPTYCRKHIVSRTVSLIAAQERYGVLTLVSDNCSNDGSVQELRSLSSTCDDIVIRENPSNIGFWGNIFALVATCETEWMILCSDEDLPDYKKIYQLLSQVNQESINAVIGSVDSLPGRPRTLKRILTDSASTSQEAYNTNYVSGIVFNVDTLCSSNLLDFLYDESEKNEFLQIYPHKSIVLWFYALGLCRCSSLGVIQRREVAPARAPGHVPSFAILPSRWNQWLGCLEYLLYLRENIANSDERKMAIESIINYHQDMLFPSINHALRMQSRDFSDLFLSGAKKYFSID